MNAKKFGDSIISFNSLFNQQVLFFTTGIREVSANISGIILINHTVTIQG